MLIAFEGLDQSGKQTQVDRLAERLREEGRRVETLDFPDYATPLGREIEQALSGHREFPPEVMQLLFVANRCEHRDHIRQWLGEGAWVLCDRYLASSVAYGEAQGLDPVWLFEIQAVLPQPDLTVLLDLAPDVAAPRKRDGRDRFERDLALLARVRESYLRQAGVGQWLVIDAARGEDEVAAAVREGLHARCGR